MQKRFYKLTKEITQTYTKYFTCVSVLFTLICEDFWTSDFLDYEDLLKEV